MAINARIDINLNRKIYSAGHFALEIDGVPLKSAYLKNIDGGYIKGNTVTEPIGPDLQQIKHLTTREIDPINFELGMSGCEYILGWIKSSWQRKFVCKNGMISHADFNGQCRLEHEFSDALITETAFPALDSSSKEAAYLKVKIQPQGVKQRPGSGKITMPMGHKQKQWTASAFRLTVDGVKTEYVSKIEAFTIKQGVKALNTGVATLPEYVPTKLEFPDISVTMPESESKEVFKWYQDFVVKGMKDPIAERTGSIEFLSPDRAKTLFTVNLFGVGIRSFVVNKSDAKADQIKRCKFDMYVGAMELDGPGALGME